MSMRPESQGALKFRLLTYNIHKGIGGLDRKYRPERICEAIGRYQPDIVLIQEVDDGVPRSSGHRQVDLLGDALGLPHRAFQANVTLKRGHYGNAILSRFPLSDVHHLDLSVPLKKRRQALIASCHLQHGGHSRTVKVVNFHLGLAGYERRMQVRRFLTSDVLSDIHRDTAVVAGGDLNDVWDALGRQLFVPAGFMPAASAIRTFPAYLPILPLDRVYHRGGIKVLHSFACPSRLARHASDHRPLIVDFEMPV